MVSILVRRARVPDDSAGSRGGVSYSGAMTPEERFTRMENVLEALIATQVQHSAQLEKQNAAIEKQQTVIDKQSADIRNLIRAARAFVKIQTRTDARIAELAASQQEFARAQQEFARTQQEFDGKYQKLVESQQETEHKLNALIDTVDRLSNTVDRFIKSLGKPNGAR